MAKKNGAGRPTIMAPELIAKLEEAFAWGCSDIEACLWAEIAPATLYKFQKRHPEFVERKAALKETPILLSRKAVVNAIKRGDKVTALAYLDRKKKDEFSTKQNIDHTTNGKELPAPILGGATHNGVPSDDSDKKTPKAR